MNQPLQSEQWYISEDVFEKNQLNNATEEFSLSNGLIKQSANFEENCTSESQRNSYLKGVFSFINDNKQLARLPDWTSLNVRLNAEMLDLSACNIIQYNRTLNMQTGLLERNFEIITAENHHIEVSVQRFISLDQPEIAAIKYSVKSIDFSGRISFLPVINAELITEDSSKVEPEWNVLQSKCQRDVAHLWIQTRKTNYQVCQAMTYDLFKNNAQIKYNPTKIEKQKVAGFSLGTDVKDGDSVCVYKFVSILNSNDHPYRELTDLACEKALTAKQTGWFELLETHCLAWTTHWDSIKKQTSGELKKQDIIRHFHEISDLK